MATASGWLAAVLGCLGVALTAGPALAAAPPPKVAPQRLPPSPSRACQVDAECRFAFRDPCFCPPCGEAWRRAENVTTYDAVVAGWAIKVPHCQPCRRCDAPTRWRGTEAVCLERQCAVVERPPTPLVSFLEVQVGRRVYTLDVVWRDGQLVPAARLRAPRRHTVRLAWTNLDRWPALAAEAGVPGARRRVDFIVDERTVEQIPGERRWRTTWYARVVTRP